MRLAVFVSSVSALGLLSLVSACSSSDGAASTNYPAVDGGSGGTGGKKSSGDGGAPRDDDDDAGHTGGKDDGGVVPSGDLTSKALKTGTAQLLGTTSGSSPMAVYLAVENEILSLEAMALTGGTPTVIATGLTGEEDFGVSGGAVWWYTALTPSGLGTVNFWTKANGAKTAVASGSKDGYFWASEEGDRVAFSVGGGAKTTELAVTNSATPAATAVLTDNYALDFPTSECFPDVGFVGSTLFAAFCSVQTTGSVNSTAARIVSVDAGGAVKRLDASGNSNNTIALTVDKPLWYANAAGTKLFVIGSGASAEARILDVASAPAAGSTVVLDSAVKDGYILDDGTAIYTTGTAIRRSNGTGSPKTLTTANVKAFLTRTANGDRLLFRSLDPVGDYELVDLRAINTSVENQFANDLMPTASVSLSGLANKGAHVLYLSSITDDANGNASGILKAMPFGGGPDLQIATGSLGGMPVPGTSGVVAGENLKEDADGNLLLALKHIDVVSTTAMAISDDVFPNAWNFVGKKFVYTRAGTTPGIYVVELP